jgi:hypothetical protein
MITDNASLESALDFWDWFEYGATALVLIGVIGEYVADFTRVSESNKWKNLVGKISTLLLIVGISGELLGLVKISEYSGKIIALLNERAARAIKDAGDAMQKAAEAESHLAGARKDAAEARERAAKAEKATEDEKVERLKLEKQVAPRRLPKEQREAVAAALTKFKGRVVRVISLSMDVESDILAAQIILALRRAAISVEDLRGKFSIMGGSPVGIIINGPIGDQDLVKALVDSLSRHGKLLNIRNRGSQPFPATDPTKGVNILVAPKPPSDIEELSKETS